MTIELPFMDTLSPANAVSLWRQAYQQWTGQTRLRKKFERERIYCANCTDADQRRHRGWTAALLAKGEELSLQLDDLAVESAERERLGEAIRLFLEDFRDTLLGYWTPREGADPRLAVLGA